LIGKNKFVAVNCICKGHGKYSIPYTEYIEYRGTIYAYKDRISACPICGDRQLVTAEEIKQAIKENRIRML